MPCWSATTPRPSAVVHSAIEDFAQELAYVTRRFLKTKAWEKTERIVVGGGFRDSRLGELAIARTEIILKAGELQDRDAADPPSPRRRGPDRRAASRAFLDFRGHDSILAVDIGGTNIRCGVVETRRKKSPDLSKASVWKSELWRHADDEPSREEAVKRLVKMLKDLIAKAEKEGFKLAPFIGVACPGVIKSDGSIEKGAQNLPGNWESSKFNLPASLVEAIPQIGRARHRHRHAQRRRGAGAVGGALHAGREALGRADDRHGPGQRALHQPQRQGRALKPSPPFRRRPKSFGGSSEDPPAMISFSSAFRRTSGSFGYPDRLVEKVEGHQDDAFGRSFELVLQDREVGGAVGGRDDDLAVNDGRAGLDVPGVVTGFPR